MNLLEKTELLIVVILAVLAGLRFLLLGEKDSWLRRNHQFVVVVAWLVDGLLFLAWFRNNEAAWEYFLTLIELVGVTILSREVWFAQHIEKIRDSISRRARAVAVPWNRFPADPTKDISGAIDYLWDVNSILREHSVDDLREHIGGLISANKVVTTAENKQLDQSSQLTREEQELDRVPALEYRRNWLFTGLLLVVGSLAFHAMLTKIDIPHSKSLNIVKFEKSIQFGTGVFALKDPRNLQKDLMPVVCLAKYELLRSGTSLAIVIGRHDSMPVKRPIMISNLEIAQQRAEAVDLPRLFQPVITEDFRTAANSFGVR